MLPRQFAKIWLPEAGTYTVFHEDTWDFGDGQPKPTETEARAIDFQIAEVGRGPALSIPLRPSSPWVRYRIGSRGGYALYDFEIDAPGDYTFHGDYVGQPPDGGRTVVFVIAHDYRGRVLRLVLASIAAFSVPLLVALWLRRRAKASYGV